MVIDMYLKEIPISSILSESKDVSIHEGWGGKHIKYFPPYGFFRMYISGEENKAKDSMRQWYFNRFVRNKLCVVPKTEGGMMGGSLFEVLEKIHKSKGIDLKADLSNGDNELIMKGIEDRVKGRFQLIKSILMHGYEECGDFIYLKKTGDYHTLIDGHHRVAAMAACGYPIIKGTTKNNILLKLIKKNHKSKQAEAH